MKKNKSNTKIIHAMIPQGLPDLDTMFSRKTDADRARVVLRYLFFMKLRMKYNPNYAGGVLRESGYCPTVAETLKATTGKWYRRDIVNKLIEQDIIQIRENEKTRKESFVPNSLTKLYRVKAKWLVKNHKGRRYRLEKIEHADVTRALIEYYKNYYLNQRKALAAHGKIYVDISKFGERFSIDLTRLESDIQNDKLQDEEDLLGLATVTNDQLSRWVSVDDFGYRLHSHLGNVPKILRPYLILTDIPSTQLVIADIKSSEPYFLSLLFFNPELLNLVSEFLSVKHILDENRHQPDLRTFYEDTASGEFYKKALLIIGGDEYKGQEIPEEVKAELKKKLFRHVFYGSTGNYHKNFKEKEERQQVLSRFSMVYPTVVKNLMALKKVSRTTLPFVYEVTRKNKKAGKMYATPSCLAQRFETQIVLKIIATAMFQMKAPVFTIHDAFILEESHLGLLKQVFEQVFRERLKVKPPKLEIILLQKRDNNIAGQ